MPDAPIEGDGIAIPDIGCDKRRLRAVSFCPSESTRRGSVRPVDLPFMGDLLQRLADQMRASDILQCGFGGCVLDADPYRDEPPARQTGLDIGVPGMGLTGPFFNELCSP